MRHHAGRSRQKVTALTGLIALAVHLAAFSLAALMPVTTALAAAQAEPFEIVICTVHGPITIDARELGIEISGETSTPDLPRTACDLDLQTTAAIAIDTPPLLLSAPVRYVDTSKQQPMADTRPAYATPLNRASPPRAPPHTS